MNKLLMVGTAAGALCMSDAALAQGVFLPVHGNVALYGSYLHQTDDPDGLDSDGGGGGVQLGVSLTRHFFIDGSYQYDYLHQNDAPSAGFALPPGGQVSYGMKVNQGRAGGGLVFRLVPAPLDLFGKVEYTHYDYQFVHLDTNLGGFGPGSNSDRLNDDGVGFHAGLQTRLPGISIYGSVGYLELSKSEGPEFNLGFEVPMAPLLWGFVEYRYDNLRATGGNDFFVRDQLSNARAGLRMSF